MKNPSYLKAVRHFVGGSYAMDVASGDITTASFVKNPKQPVTARIISKQSGILAGMLEARWLLDSLHLKSAKLLKDGSRLKKGSLIMEIRGPADQILAAERTLLNLLQRMSGIATATYFIVQKVPKSVQIFATRKTFWGVLDKRAVEVGGGHPHRIHLAEAVLIKDNHWKLTKNFEHSFQSVLKKASKAAWIEVEVENIPQLKKVLSFRKKYPKRFIVMLDNFSPKHVKRWAPILKKAGLTVEVSGGITPKNIRSYCVSGVSRISLGWITAKAPTLDISLDLL